MLQLLGEMRNAVLVNTKYEMSVWFLTALIEDVPGTRETKSDYMKEENYTKKEINNI